MSLCYSIDVELAINTTKENILKILDNGLKIGCIYYHNENFPPETKKLDIDDTTTQILSNLNNTRQLPRILTQCSDTFVSIFFYSPKPQKLVISLMPTHSIWKIEDEHGIETVDVARYLNIVAGLCKNCVIESIKVDIS